MELDCICIVFNIVGGYLTYKVYVSIVCSTPQKIWKNKN